MAFFSSSDSTSHGRQQNLRMEAIKDVIGYNKRPLTSSSKVREEHLSLGKINRAVMLLKIMKVYQSDWPESLGGHYIRT